MIQDEALNEKTTQETQFGIQARSSGIFLGPDGSYGSLKA